MDAAAKERDENYEAYCEWQQRQIDLRYISDELREQALAGHISTNLRGLVAAAGGTFGVPGMGHLSIDGVTQEPTLSGSEPPPTPAVQRRRRQVKEEEEEGTTNSAVDDRYMNACAVVGLQTKPAVLKVLRNVEQGAQALPVEFSHQSFLGNRGGQALFLALAADTEDIGIEQSELRELRNLDFEGHGLGNEAAMALASLLPRCPRLRKVNLARNHISESGAMRLMDEIQMHPSLDTLIIDQNPVPSWLRVRLKDLLAARKEDPWHDTKTKRIIQEQIGSPRKKKETASAPGATPFPGQNLGKCFPAEVM
jgi:hypothetical protein